LIAAAIPDSQIAVSEPAMARIPGAAGATPMYLPKGADSDLLMVLLADAILIAGVQVRLDCRGAKPS
jgi:hypothetical protein